MVIKTDELPAAAPADSAREPSSQAGGKGRPGSTGERGWGQGGARKGRLHRAERAGWFGVPRGPPPSLRAGLVASRRALYRAAPALKVTFTIAPSCGPGFARGVPERAAAAGTRASNCGDTCAHTRFRGAPPPPQMDRIGGPTPSVPRHWGALRSGVIDTCSFRHPSTSGSQAFPVHILQSCKEGSTWGFQAWSVGRAVVRMSIARGFLWFILRGKALTPGVPALLSAGSGNDLVGGPGGLPVCGTQAKLLGRKRCLCQNLIINPPYCEKWVGPQLQFLRQRSLVWSGAPSSSPWGPCDGGGFGRGRSNVHFSWASLFPSIMSQSLALRLKLHPSQSVVIFKSSSEAQGCTLVPFCPGWSWEGRITLISHFPPTLLNRTCHFHFPSQLLVSQDGHSVREAL